MPFYWSLGQVPELAGLSKQRRAAVWRSAYAQSFRDWRHWLAIVALIAFLSVGNAIAREIGAGMIGVVLVCAVGGAVYGQLAIHLVRPRLRAAEPPT